MPSSWRVVRQFWEALRRQSTGTIDVLSAESLLEQALLAGEVDPHDRWQKASDLVVERGSHYGFPSFFDLYFDQVAEYAALTKMRLETVNDLVSVIRRRNGQRAE